MRLRFDVNRKLLPGKIAFFTMMSGKKQNIDQSRNNGAVLYVKPTLISQSTFLIYNT